MVFKWYLNVLKKSISPKKRFHPTTGINGQMDKEHINPLNFLMEIISKLFGGID